MLMPNLLRRTAFGLAVATAACLSLELSLATPASAGTIYSWETADGHVAYTDDLKKVPARYRDAMRVSQSAGIEDYARFTGQDSARSESHAQQLAERLAYLRSQSGARPAEMPYEQNVGVATVTVSGVDLRLPAADSSQPIIVEKLRVKGAGQIATRHDTLVRQGEVPLAIVRGDQVFETNAPANILNEDDLELYE